MSPAEVMPGMGFPSDDPAFVERVLKARARRLAARRREQASVAQGVQVLCFAIAGETYAVALDRLVEVLPLASVAPVPGVSPALAGVTNVRGEIRPVLNLHHMLTLAPPEAGARHFGVFLRGGARPVGLRVDGLRQIRDLALDSLTLPHKSGNGLPQRYIRGISPDTVIVLDPEQILAQDLLRERRGGQIPAR